MKNFSLKDEAIFVVELDTNKDAYLSEDGNVELRDVGEVCVLPETYGNFDGFADADFLSLCVEVVGFSWKTYLNYLGRFDKEHETVCDFIDWHNEQFNKVKIGFVYKNIVAG